MRRIKLSTPFMDLWLSTYLISQRSTQSQIQNWKEAVAGGHAMLLRLTGMCPGFEDWWLYKSVLNLQNMWSFNFYTQIIPREFLVDTICMCYIKQLAMYFHWCWYCSTDQWICSGDHFIWVVVCVTTAYHCGHIPALKYKILMILPKDHPLTSMIIYATLKEQLHAWVTSTVTSLRHLISLTVVYYSDNVCLVAKLWESLTWFLSHPCSHKPESGMWCHSKSPV